MPRARIGLVAAACCLLPWSLGCCPIDGRGTLGRLGCWLALDRLPGLDSAADRPGSEGGACACPPEVGCGDGGVCPAHGGRAAASLAEPEHIHARFFPVPTRPVFWPRPAPFPPIAGGPFPQSPWEASAAGASSSFHKDKPPAPSEIHSPKLHEQEVPPAPLPPLDREVQAPRPFGVAASDRSWMFPLPAAGGGWRGEQGQARRTNEGAMIR